MREFRRHSTDIPVNILGKDVALESDRPLYNVSYGGLACYSGVLFQPGELVSVHISHVDPPFEANGIVVWCDPVENGYEVGIQFNEGREAFAARMVAQVCQIEQYKIDVLEKEGRELSGDEAALEWVEKNAHRQAVHERSYIRHPVDVPIEISRAKQTEPTTTKLRNYSLEGACFESASEIKLGEYVQIQLPQIDDQPAREVEGVVMWCCRKNDKYDVGVKFKDDDEVFYAEMLKQISRLEGFRDEMKRRYGRELAGEELVMEFAAYMAKTKLQDAG